jgi:hypothetical protein
MTLMRKTMGGGLEYVCDSVLRPHFHAGGSAKKVSEVITSTAPLRYTQSKPREVHSGLHWLTVCVKIHRERRYSHRLIYGYPSMLSALRFGTITL